MNQTTQTYPDFFRVQEQAGAAAVRIEQRYEVLLAPLKNQLTMPPCDQHSLDVALDRFMRLAKRRHQEYLRQHAEMDSYLALRPSCACNAVHVLGRRCELCTTTARYTVQQERELALPAGPREAARRARVHALYVEITCRERMRELSTLTYEPKTGRRPTQMPQLCGVGRLWSEHSTATA